MFKKICINCKVEYDSDWNGRKLCSNKCRYDWQRGRKRISKKIGWNLPLIHKERKGKTIEELYGKEKAREIKDKLKKSQRKVNRNGKNNAFYGKTHTNQVRLIIANNMSKIMKEKWQNQDYKEKTIRKILKSLLKKPSSFEQKFIDYFKDRNLNFEYVGDGKFFINGLNPDFVNKKKKIVIEVFYSWFKIRNYGSVENYINLWTKRYKEKGWNPIFISEEIVKNKNFDSKVEILIKPYLKQEKL